MPGRDTMFAPGCMVIAITALTLAACGRSMSSVKKTLDNPQYTDHSYGDILVAGVAGDYDNRAAFERAMVSRIKAEGASASAYYTVVGRNQPITRNAVSAAVESRGYDAVSLARIISSETSVSMTGDSSQTKITRKPVDRAIDLFRYNYDELMQPGDITVLRSVTLSAEMFSGADETRMWGIETTISDMENIGQLIEVAADTIMEQLDNDQLIGD